MAKPWAQHIAGEVGDLGCEPAIEATLALFERTQEPLAELYTRVRMALHGNTLFDAQPGTRYPCRFRGSQAAALPTCQGRPGSLIIARPHTVQLLTKLPRSQ